LLSGCFDKKIMISEAGPFHGNRLAAFGRLGQTSVVC
jgi:hypothetical protein